MSSPSSKRNLASTVATSAGADPDALKIVVEDPVSPRQQREAAERKPPEQRADTDGSSSNTQKVEKSTPVWVYCIFGVLVVSLVALVAMYIHNKAKNSSDYRAM